MFKYWLSAVLAVFIASFSQILLKKAATIQYENKIREYLNMYVILGYFLMIVSTLLVVYSYKGIEYKNGAVIESLGYIVVMILSYLFFNEKISKEKAIGIGLILLGVFIFYL